MYDFNKMDHGKDNIIGLLIWVVQNKGFFTLYNGFIVKITQSVLNSGIMLMLY